jgi:hypothetical protein
MKWCKVHYPVHKNSTYAGLILERGDPSYRGRGTRDLGALARRNPRLDWYYFFPLFLLLHCIIDFTALRVKK